MYNVQLASEAKGRTVRQANVRHSMKVEYLLRGEQHQQDGDDSIVGIFTGKHCPSTLTDCEQQTSVV